MATIVPAIIKIPVNPASKANIPRPKVPKIATPSANAPNPNPVPTKPTDVTQPKVGYLSYFPSAKIKETETIVVAIPAIAPRPIAKAAAPIPAVAKIATPKAKAAIPNPPVTNATPAAHPIPG